MSESTQNVRLRVEQARKELPLICEDLWLGSSYKNSKRRLFTHFVSIQEQPPPLKWHNPMSVRSLKKRTSLLQCQKHKGGKGLQQHQWPESWDLLELGVTFFFIWGCGPAEAGCRQRKLQPGPLSVGKRLPLMELLLFSCDSDVHSKKVKQKQNYKVYTSHIQKRQMVKTPTISSAHTQ